MFESLLEKIFAIFGQSIYDDSMKTPSNIIDTIGYNGPNIMIFICLYELWNQPVYYWGFVILTIINIFFNKFLKLCIREPRPIKITRDHFTELDKLVMADAEYYGMPSGHAQSITFSIFYLYLVRGSIFWLYVGLFLFLITLYQRWVSKKHSIQQLIIGSIVGSTFGYVSYSCLKNMCK
jgi:membrane-associated phospholipid phosphatase